MPRSYSSEFARRQARARAAGWSGYGQQRYWQAALRDDDYVRQLAEQIGGPVEADRPNALMSRKANAIVNPIDRPRDGDWRVRLLIAAGKIPRRPLPLLIARRPSPR